MIGFCGRTAVHLVVLAIVMNLTSFEWAVLTGLAFIRAEVDH